MSFRVIRRSLTTVHEALRLFPDFEQSTAALNTPSLKTFWTRVRDGASILYAVDVLGRPGR